MKYIKVIQNSNNLRFYKYEDIRDKIFLIVANPLSYIFFKIGINANTISIVSGFFAILGGILLSSEKNSVAFFGAMCVPIFYLLDYVDGIVARLNKKPSVGGQYLDLIMHQVVTISISIGIFIGALNSDGKIVIPFGILSVLASSLLLSRFAIGWFSIIMKYCEDSSLENVNQHRKKIKNKIKNKNLIILILLRLGSFIFHEDYAIFSLPLLFFLNIFFHHLLFFDVRTFLSIYGGLILFPAIILDIIYYSKYKIDSNYYLFLDKKFKPKLPDFYYFKY